MIERIIQILNDPMFYAFLFSGLYCTWRMYVDYQVEKFEKSQGLVRKKRKGWR